jgi:hypothetical protein
MADTIEIPEPQYFDPEDYRDRYENIPAAVVFQGT